MAAPAARLGTALAYNLLAGHELRGRRCDRRVSRQHAAAAVNVAPLSLAFRVLAGLIMLAAAGRLLFGWRLLDPLEAAGSGLWRRHRAVGRGNRDARAASAARSALGLAWGWLPCGMTYSMLLLAATTAGAASGAAVMVAFGVGTLPSMVTATVAFDRIARGLSRACHRCAESQAHCCWRSDCGRPDMRCTTRSATAARTRGTGRRPRERPRPAGMSTISNEESGS